MNNSWRLLGSTACTHKMKYINFSQNQNRPVFQGLLWLPKILPMKHAFKVGDHVEWNSEAGRVRGTIKKKVTSAIKFKTYTVRASKEEPQYLIKSDKTDHLAMHKGAALKKLGKSNRPSCSGRAHKKGIWYLEKHHE